MARVIWTEQATEDLENIAEFIAKDSVRYAKITITNIRNKVRNLKEHSMLGRVVPEQNNKTVRELIYSNYRIIYQIKSGQIISVLVVHHSARLFDSEKVNPENE